MSSERKPDKTAPGRTQASEHGRFAQTLRRFRSRPTNGEPPSALQGPPLRTASAGTRRPVARSADAVQPPAPRRAASARKSASGARSESLIPLPELLAPRRSAKPPEPEPPAPNLPDDEPTQTWALRWRWTPMIIGVAVLCWIVALSLLFTGSSPMAPRLSSPRLTFVVVWVIASLFTFVPLEFRLGLPGLTVQGVTGWTFLGYILAFAPPPAGPPVGWLFDLPDLPVYLLFFLALFYAVSAAALPLTVIGGRRVWVQRCSNWICAAPDDRRMNLVS